MISVSTGDGEKSKPNTIGKYQVIGTLGRGSMGVVYKARDPEIGRVVAIKTLRKIAAAQFHDADEALARFKIEARSAGNLRHPNIITVFDVNIQDDIPYIVMDYVEGESLVQILARYSRLRKDLALYYLKQIAAGLDAAHAKGVIHRDVKPSNIIVDKAENCYVADFGVASVNESLSESESKGKNEPVMGTPGYMAPEQILNKRLDHRTDLFSFAVVAFECFAGKRPFPGSSFTEVLSNILNAAPLSLTSLVDLPLALEAEFERALSKKPEERFASGEEMIAAFAKAVGIDRIDKPTLSAIPGEERGKAKTSGDGEWKSVSLGESKESTQASSPGAAAGGGGELKKGPRVPLGDDDYKTIPNGDTLLGGEWDHPHNLESTLAPVPGEMFKHVKEPLGTIYTSGRPRLVSILTVLLLLVSGVLGAHLLWQRPEPPPLDSPALPGPGGQSASAPRTPRIEEEPGLGSPMDLKVDPVPAGKMVTEMRDREILGLLVNTDSQEDEILGALGEAKRRNIPELIEAARALLNHDSHIVRTETIKILRDLDDKRAVPLLVEALNDHDPLVRGFAANALGTLGSRKALGYLSATYQREDVPEVKIALRRAIEKINGYPLGE